ncbi:putative transcription factor and/or regulators TTF-type(Zn) family [Arabidopsis thaliana]
MNVVYPIDNVTKRHFAYKYYFRRLCNGETDDRKWLIYSKHVDKVLLATEGLRDWKHFGDRLKNHEKSEEHITNMRIWNDLKARFLSNQTIDKEFHKEIAKEKERWRQVLYRITSVVKFLSKRNLAFRG